MPSSHCCCSMILFIQEILFWLPQVGYLGMPLLNLCENNISPFICRDPSHLRLGISVKTVAAVRRAWVLPERGERKP